MLTDKKAELEESARGAAGELDTLKAQLRTESKIQNEISEELVGKADQYEQDLDALLGVLGQMKEQHLEMMKKAQAQVAWLQQEKARLQEDAAAERGRLEEEHKKQLAAIQTRHEMDLIKKAEEHQEKLNQKFVDGKNQGGRRACAALLRLSVCLTD